MMRDMMGGMRDMCGNMGRQMMGSVTFRGDEAYGTPEIKALFEEWVKLLEDEIIEFITGNAGAQPAAIARAVKLSEESVLFFLGKLIREGRITAGEFRVSGKGGH